MNLVQVVQVESCNRNIMQLRCVTKVEEKILSSAIKATLLYTSWIYISLYENGVHCDMYVKMEGWTYPNRYNLK